MTTDPATEVATVIERRVRVLDKLGAEPNSLSAFKAVCEWTEDAAALLARTAKERDEARKVQRWNIDQHNREMLYICRGEHEKTDKCEWETFVPIARAEAAEAQVERLTAALTIAVECGGPTKASLFDEEGVDGWRWTHPDGREWTEIGDWDELPPAHPVLDAALQQERKT